MTTTTKTARQLTAEETERAKVLVNTALDGFLKRNPAATEQQGADFVVTVGKSIIASILKNAGNVGKSERESRLKAVKALADQFNVKFLHRREQGQGETLVDIAQVDKTNHLEKILVTTFNETRGGETIAYVYELTENNDLLMVYSTAFCRPDENFDPLIGMEESLKKFLNDDVLVAPIVHERLGQVKLTQLVNAYKHTENAAISGLAEKLAEAGAPQVVDLAVFDDSTAAA